MKKKLTDITLLGVDCVDIGRLILAAEICEKDFEFGKVKLFTSIKSDHKNIVPINPILSVAEYSRFIIAELDHYVDTPFVLIIQHDGFILNPNAWADEYLNYDYIGAPWLVRNVSVNRFGFPKELLGQRIVGNGGFSLRSKRLLSLCAGLCEQGFFKTYHPEDVIIAVKQRKFFEEQGIRFAPVPLAQRFSFEAEDMEHYSWDDQFGFHGLWYTDISKWTREHLEYKIDNTLRAPGKKHKYV